MVLFVVVRAVVALCSATTRVAPTGFVIKMPGFSLLWDD